MFVFLALDILHYITYRKSFPWLTPQQYNIDNWAFIISSLKSNVFSQSISINYQLSRDVPAAALHTLPEIKYKKLLVGLPAKTPTRAMLFLFQSFIEIRYHIIHSFFLWRRIIRGTCYFKERHGERLNVLELIAIQPTNGPFWLSF